MTQFIYGQCVKGDCYNGNGKYIFKDKSWFNGEWSQGNYVNGEYFYGTSGDNAVGVFKNRFLVEGKYNYKKSGDNAVGVFKNGLLVEGKYNFLNGSWSEGKFENLDLVDGVEFYKYKNGQACYFIYENGLKIKSTCNNQNQYNQDDIVFGPYSRKINLQKFDDNPNAYYVVLTINNKKVKFHFDTGCSLFTMNLTQWNELSKGLDFEDLKISGISEAVGAEYNMKYYKILEPIKIDEYSIKNVIVGVTQIKSPKNPDKDNLIGIGFFNKFSNVIWNMSEETIKLYF